MRIKSLCLGHMVTIRKPNALGVLLCIKEKIRVAGSQFLKLPDQHLIAWTRCRRYCWVSPISWSMNIVTFYFLIFWWQSYKICKPLSYHQQ